MNLVAIVFILPIIVLIFAIPIGWMIGKITRKIIILSFHSSIANQTTIKSEYQAPGKLNPAEVAYLYDKTFGEEELLATLFDLELRGYLKLQPTDDLDINFYIKIIRDPMDKHLNDFEKEVMLTIKSYEHESTWKTLNSDSAIWDSNIELKLEMELIKKGYLLMPNPKMKAIKYLAIGASISIITILVLRKIYDIGSDYDPNNIYSDLKRDTDNFVLFFFWLYGAFFYGISAYFGISAYYNSLDLGKGTALLKKIWPELEGFKEYLEVVEQDRIEFENKELKEHARQSSLPYATALNMTTRWQDRFK